MREPWSKPRPCTSAVRTPSLRVNTVWGKQGYTVTPVVSFLGEYHHKVSSCFGTTIQGSWGPALVD
jgi:hypothetical protein